MDRTRPLRTVAVSLALYLHLAAAHAQSVHQIAPLQSAEVEYRLGGAAEISAVSPSAGTLPQMDIPGEPFRYPFRPPPSLLKEGQRETALGEISVFGGEAREDGRDVLRLGTALTRGKTTSGFGLVYRDEEPAARSELFMDYALSDAFSVGVSGILSNGDSAPEDPVARLGVSAAYSREGGSYLQGAIAGAPDTGTVIGLSVGLRF